ncbi:MAG: glycosyltransferase [Deltaproteobacteria bacterium]|nr:glycosyltransferase [Deltaproteobacteria bacterium]
MRAKVAGAKSRGVAAAGDRFVRPARPDSFGAGRTAEWLPGDTKRVDLAEVSSVLFVTQVEVDADSGNARHVRALVSALTAAGTPVELLAPGADRSRLREPPPGARLEALLAARVILRARVTRPDLGYLRLSASTSFTAAAFRVAGVPYLLELNGPVLDQLRARGRPEWVVATAKRSLAWVVRESRGVVVPSPALERHARVELGADRVFVVENGVDLEVVVPGDRALARKRLGLPLDRTFVTLVATLTPELRLDLLGEACSRLDKTGLLIVGDGFRAGEVQDLVRRATPERPVIALGARPHAEAVLAMQAGDVCVNPHDSDLALKGLEYAAAGRRQACFFVPGIERLAGLYSGLDGVVVASESSGESLRGALSKALLAERAFGPLPADAVARARAELGWEKKAERLLSIFDRTLAESPARR